MEPTTVESIELIMSPMINQEPDMAKRKILMEMIKKPILTNSDFAFLFSISLRSCHRWRIKEGIPYIRISRRIYYLWNTLIPLLESRQMKN